MTLALVVVGAAWAATPVAPPKAEKTAEGERAFWSGDYVGAELAFFEVLLAAPDDAGAHYYLGRIYQIREDAARALVHYERAAGPAYPEAYFFLGSIYFGSRCYDESAEAYQKYLEFYGDDATAWYNLGVSRGAAGKEEDAEAAYHKALDANPRHAPSVYNLAVLHHQRGDYGRAAFFWERYLELAPDDAGGYYGLGLAYYYGGEFLKAARAFDAGARAAPLDGRFFYQLGRTYLKLAEFDLAAACYARAFELGYDEGAVAEGLGLAFEGTRSYAKAIPLLKRGVELRGDQAGESYAALGRIDRAQGRPGPAVENFYAAAARLADPGDAYNAIGEVYLEEDLPTWAAEAFRRAVDASPDNVAFNYNLAAAYDRAEPRRAVDQWQRYLMLAGELPTERRRADEARKRLKQLVSDYPEEENR